MNKYIDKYFRISTKDKITLCLQSSLLCSVMIINYILYCTKDSLAVHHMGPESIVFMRTYLVIPIIFIFFMFYSKLLNIIKLQHLFSLVIFLFVVYFLSFSYLIYPKYCGYIAQIDKFSISSIRDIWANMIAHSAIINYYIVCELWTNFVLGVMAWQFLNAINTQESAHNNYYFFQFISNLAIILTGQIIFWIGTTTFMDWQDNLQYLSTIVAFLGGIIVLMKNKLSKIYNETGPQKEVKKLKLSLVESIKLISTSIKTKSLFVAIFSYGICNSFLETSFRYYLHLAFPSIREYNNALALQTSCIGLFTLLFIIIGAYLSSNNKYRASFLLTPAMLFAGITLILPLSMLRDNNLSTVWCCLIYIIYFIKLVVIKSSKYGLIDPVKEFVYLSQDIELRNKGKAAVDGVSNRLGKSCGNFFQQLLFVFIGNLNLSVHLFPFAIMFFSLIWIKNIRNQKIYQGINIQRQLNFLKEEPLTKVFKEGLQKQVGG